MLECRPDLLLIVCEGTTESEYFTILQRQFRLPTWIKVFPELGDHKTLGQHAKLIQAAAEKRQDWAKNLDDDAAIEVWAVCDRDDFRDSFIKLRDLARESAVELAFSDPQFENYLLQHFSANRSDSRGRIVEKELSDKIGLLYKKTDLSWLNDMIDRRHSIVTEAIRNADHFTKHNKKPFFTVQNLVRRLLQLQNEIGV